jgi:hypothetical protein
MLKERLPNTLKLLYCALAANAQRTEERLLLGNEVQNGDTNDFYKIMADTKP